jgi:DnaJ-class molecular chaperone
MTHYATLGVSETATPDEIKRAYRKLASQHHPDRGGDTATFQTIQAAYEVIGDEGRRQQYDHERRNPGAFRFTVNGQDMQGHPNIDDMLRNFGFNFGGNPFGNPFVNPHQPRRNKDLKIEIVVPLASTLTEQTKTISVQTTNGHRETVEVNIPRGVTSGSQIKYPGLGDNFFNTLARGDLYVVIHVETPNGYSVEGLDIITGLEIDCFCAIVGGEVEVAGFDGSRFKINIPPGLQPGAVMRLGGQGVWQLNGSQRGNLLVKIAITVPKNLSDAQLNLVRQIQTMQ